MHVTSGQEEEEEPESELKQNAEFPKNSILNVLFHNNSNIDGLKLVGLKGTLSIIKSKTCIYYLDILKRIIYILQI